MSNSTITLPARCDLQAAMWRTRAFAHGDSNDAEIEALREFRDLAVAALGLDNSDTETDEVRGAVCMELRDLGHPDLADEVGGWGDEQFRATFPDATEDDADQAAWQFAAKQTRGERIGRALIADAQRTQDRHEQRPGLTITRAQIEEWAGPLTDEQVKRLAACVPGSSIPDAIGSIVLDALSIDTTESGGQ